MAKLIFLGEKFAGRVYEFAVEKTTVGRGDQNTLTIHDSSVSTAHCEILVFGPEVIVRDLGSRNGTVVNGVRLHQQQCQLQAGQIVKFGSVEARLELPTPSSSDTATDNTAVHAYSQYLRQQQNGHKQPATSSMTLEAGSESAPADHTLVMSRPPHAPETIMPPAPENPHGHEKPAKRTVIAIVVATFALALAVLLWLIWGRG